MPDEPTAPSRSSSCSLPGAELPLKRLMSRSSEITEKAGSDVLPLEKMLFLKSHHSIRRKVHRRSGVGKRVPNYSDVTRLRLQGDALVS